MSDILVSLLMPVGLALLSILLAKALIFLIYFFVYLFNDYDYSKDNGYKKKKKYNYFFFYNGQNPSIIPATYPPIMITIINKINNNIGKIQL